MLGNAPKVNVEIYLENYEGTGYEKQEKQVSVKEELQVIRMNQRTLRDLHMIMEIEIIYLQRL